MDNINETNKEREGIDNNLSSFLLDENITPEQYQQRIDVTVNSIHELLNGLTMNDAKIILEAAIHRLQNRSYVQPAPTNKLIRQTV